MCKECGCGASNGNTRLQFNVKGYTEESAKGAEKALLGLAGVLYVHIHAHDGETTVDYDPAKTKLTEILGIFEERGLSAALGVGRCAFAASFQQGKMAPPFGKPPEGALFA